jgi:hypothetical protein
VGSLGRDGGMMCVCMSILNRLWWFCEEVMGDRGMEEEEEDEKGAEDEDEDRGEGEDVDGVVVVFVSIFLIFDVEVVDALTRG